MKHYLVLPKVFLCFVTVGVLSACVLELIELADLIPQASRYVYVDDELYNQSCFTQEGEQTSRSTPYRIAIFPPVGELGWVQDAGVEERIARILQKNIEEDRALTLAYAYHDDSLNEPRIRKPDRLWVGGAVQKMPNLELVFTLAQERDIDGVLMYWGTRTVYASEGFPMWVYLIDVERRHGCRKKGTTKESDLDQLTRQLLAQFLAGRPQVVFAKQR